MHGLPSLPGSAARVESPLTPLFRAPLAIELARGARGKIEDGRAGKADGGLTELRAANRLWPGQMRAAVELGTGANVWLPHMSPSSHK